MPLSARDRFWTGSLDWRPIASGRSLGLTARCHYSNDNNRLVAVLRGVTPISRFAAIAVGNFFTGLPLLANDLPFEPLVPTTSKEKVGHECRGLTVLVRHSPLRALRS